MIETNGEVRMKIYEADGKGIYKWTWAGNARDAFNEETVNDVPILNMENFEFVKEAVIRNKIQDLGRRKENGKK